VTPQNPQEPRFSTLSREVENSVYVIYCELESVQALRQQNEQLRGDRARLLDGLTMSDNEISRLQRQLDSRPPDGELERLQDHVGRLNTTLEELREENEALKTDLKTAEEQAVAAKESLDTEWKEKLARLMQ
jgi:septal ring factor EnvC (AmiA/AmiB activator)